jgi:hypothetical protein
LIVQVRTGVWPKDGSKEQLQPGKQKESTQSHVPHNTYPAAKAQKIRVAVAHRIKKVN